MDLGLETRLETRLGAGRSVSWFRGVGKGGEMLGTKVTVEAAEGSSSVDD